MSQDKTYEHQRAVMEGQCHRSLEIFQKHLSRAATPSEVKIEDAAFEQGFRAAWEAAHLERTGQSVTNDAARPQLMMMRSVERWRASDPKAMARQSSAAIEYALSDARHDILALASAISNPAETATADAAYQYPLPDSFYPGSKDWIAADYAGRVEWLHYCYESVRRNLENLETQLAAGKTPASVPSAEEREIVWAAIRELGYTTRNQTDEVVDALYAALAAQPRSAT